ncbi:MULTISPECIES: hypothetical protein [Deinococcus]|uniref:Uncharacterized protein n=1 Tax=Deinococcus cavernae TaxID=2320857 RepID=A0A418V7E4_9DEIO|nr:MULTISPECIES: hypothetical protein [Deinococcus]RJF72017.1 hypothetical protein D3875_11075 [Deinococcus cavernae]
MIKLFNRSSPPFSLNATQERDILHLVQLGREVEAVKQIRRWTRLPLPEAVSMVAGYRSAHRPLAGD